MNSILSLPIFQTKKNELLDDTNELLFDELPFYGISGTICRIEEAPESYYKVLYNQDGTINPQKLPVSKKKGKKFIAIQEDYYSEVKNILTKFKDQYMEYENNKYNPTLTNNQFYILAIVTFLASMASIPFLLTTAWIGLVFETISVLSLYIVCDIHKKDVQNKKERTAFMNKYIKLERDLVDYQTGNFSYKDKKVKTEYTKIEEIDKSHLKTFPNIKMLTKEGIKEAA